MRPEEPNNWKKNRLREDKRPIEVELPSFTYNGEIVSLFGPDLRNDTVGFPRYSLWSGGMVNACE